MLTGERCAPKSDCIGHALKPNVNSGTGRVPPQISDVAQECKRSVGLRLMRGFALLRGDD